MNGSVDCSTEIDIDYDNCVIVYVNDKYTPKYPSIGMITNVVQNCGAIRTHLN